MKRSWRGLVGLWVLMWGLAWADGTQLQQVTRVFEALHQSEAALAAGNTARAQALLTDIHGVADGLRRETETYVSRARSSADGRQAELLRTVQQIDETFRLEGESDRAVREQEARIADLDAQLAQAQAVRTGLDAQMAEYQREVQIRNECLAHPLEGIFYSWDCWRLSFQDVFANRWKALNNDIADNQRQRMRIERDRQAARDEREDALRRIEMLKARKAELQARRSRLEGEERTLRAAVVRLTDAVVFWRDLGVLIKSDIGTVAMLQDSVQRLARRADAQAPTPVFDRYDAESVRSLEDTLKDFARSIDNGRNILLAPGG